MRYVRKTVQYSRREGGRERGERKEEIVRFFAVSVKKVSAIYIQWSVKTYCPQRMNLVGAIINRIARAIDKFFYSYVCWFEKTSATSNILLLF